MYRLFPSIRFNIIYTPYIYFSYCVNHFLFTAATSSASYMFCKYRQERIFIMQHDFSIVFDTENPLWIRVLEIFEKNEKYEKKVVSNRNLHHKFPRSFSKKMGEPVDNDKDNLISLTLADHFLVHYYYYILARKGYRQPMATAFTFMAKKGIKFMTPETAEAMAKDYEEAKVISVQFHRTEEYRNKM